MVKNAAYQVLAIYKCNVCKEDHQSGLVLSDLLPDPSARMAEVADMKIQVYNSIRAIFKNIHAPTDKFNPKRLTITETDDKGKSKKVKIADIEQLSKGGLSEVEKIEAQKLKEGYQANQELDKKTEKDFENTLKDGIKEETPFQDTGKKEGMSFEEIREKVKIRIAELQKASKGCREMMEKLGISLKETRMETARLQSLLKAIDQPKKKGKNNGRKKRKQSLKSK